MHRLGLLEELLKELVSTVQVVPFYVHPHVLIMLAEHLTKITVLVNPVFQPQHRGMGKGSPAVNGRGDPVQHQILQRLPDGGPADPELLGQVLLRGKLVSIWLHFHNGLAQDVIYLLRQGLFLHQSLSDLLSHKTSPTSAYFRSLHPFQAAPAWGSRTRLAVRQEQEVLLILFCHSITLHRLLVVSFFPTKKSLCFSHSRAILFTVYRITYN